MKKGRMKKLLMSKGYTRNQANEYSDYISIMGLAYEDWEIILADIIESAEDTFSRHKKHCEQNDRVCAIAKQLTGAPQNPCPRASLNICIDFALDAKNCITKILVGRRNVE